MFLFGLVSYNDPYRSPVAIGNSFAVHQRVWKCQECHLEVLEAAFSVYFKRRKIEGHLSITNVFLGQFVWKLLLEFNQELNVWSDFTHKVHLWIQRFFSREHISTILQFTEVKLLQSFFSLGKPSITPMCRITKTLPGCGQNGIIFHLHQPPDFPRNSRGFLGTKTLPFWRPQNSCFLVAIIIWPTWMATI